MSEGVEVDRRARAEEVLGEIVRRMGVKAHLEVKEVPATPAEGEKPAVPASISVALFPDEEIPNLAAGKRSPVADALQFLVNKIVNRGAEKKWINIGVGAHPPPRQPKAPPPPTPAPAQPAAQAPAQAHAQAAGTAGGQPPAQPQQGRQKHRQPKEQRKGAGEAGGKAAHVDETQLEVADDPALQALGTELAEKAASLGRIYAVIGMSAEQRAQLARGAKGVGEVGTKMEGEGRHRRLVFMPANPKPMPKKSAMPDYDDEDEGDLEE